MVSKVARTNPAKVAQQQGGQNKPGQQVVSNADLNQRPGKTPGLSFWKLTSTSGSFRFLIDHAFGDLR